MIGSGKTNFISRFGSKTNDIKEFIELLPMNIKNVVEPFGGSFAVIRDVYNDKKYNKFVNDLDPILFYVYKHPEELKKAYEVWNKINDMDLNSKEKKDKFIKTKVNDYLKQYIINSMIIRGTITISKNLENVDEDIKFMKQINFSHEDAFKVIDKFRKNKETFIFLDPPYLFSNNETYNPQKEEQDNTDFYIKFFNILNDRTTKAKIMLVINDLKILRWLYANFLKKDYDKIYQIGKKKTKHLVITNY